MNNKSVIFIINLLQDINILRPLAYLAHQTIGTKPVFIVTSAFRKRDKTGLWQSELADIVEKTLAQTIDYETVFDVLKELDGLCGVLFAASESCLDAHKPVHDLFRIAPSRFVKVTLQHGFECVGFLQSRDQNIAHGSDITFAADIICGWCMPDRLISVTSSQRHKLWVTGPTTLLNSVPLNKTINKDVKLQVGLVCENMHSPRLNALGDFKSEFLTIFNSFCLEMAKIDRQVTLRPHPGGQYVVKNSVELHSNVKLENAPIYKINLSRFAYGISAPSSILIDMVLAGIPTAVWQDENNMMDMGNYDGLTRVSNLAQWLDFVNDAILHPENYVEKQQLFLARQQIMVDPLYVHRSYTNLLLTSIGVENFLPQKINSIYKDRVLFVAPGYIPTLQLSFLKPLAYEVSAGKILIDVISENHMNLDFISKSNWSGVEGVAAKNWVVTRFKSFNPTLVVFCRYSGPHADVMLELSKEKRIPSIYHIDDDLLGIPKEIGESKHKFHNDKKRLNIVRYLLDECDLIYASTEKLKKHLISLGVKSPMIAGTIYCSGKIINNAKLRETKKIGYMASADHAHNLSHVIGALIRVLRKYPMVNFEFFGTIPSPPEFAEFGDRISHAPKIDNYEDFIARFADYQWDIGICPLNPIHFNLMKANTKWVEYTSVGAAVVASKGMVYDECCADGCGQLAETEDDWFSALDLLINRPEVRFEQVERAQKKLQQEYSIDRLRDQVLDVFSIPRFTY